MLDPLILRIIAVCFALLFLFAAVHKINNKLQFHGILEAYQILPRGMLGLTVSVIPVLELILGLAWALSALLFIRIQFVPLVSAMLLFVYALVIAINLMRGRSYIDCGCGFSPRASSAQNLSSSGGIQQLSRGLVARNVVLVIVALIAAIPPTSRDLGFIDYLSLIAAASTLVLLYGAFNQLLANRNAIGAWLGTSGRASHG